MKVLSIGTDRKLFEKDSAVSKRTILYGQKMEALHIVVLSLRSNNFTEYSLSPNIKIYPTNSKNKIGYIFDAIKIGKRIVLNEKFVRGKDVITCQDPFECGFIGWRIAKKFRLPFQLQIHTDFLSKYFQTSNLQKIRVILAKFLLPRASGVRVVSKKIFDSIRDSKINLKADPSILPIRPDVENIEKTILSPEADLKKLFPNSNFIILMASRLTSEKRIPDAIDAFNEVVQKYPNTMLCIAGEGIMKNELVKKVNTLNISKNVAFLGWRNDVLQLMKTANMFLSVSEYEGYGVTLVEAGLTKCPVLSTDVAISGDILIHNKNSYICPVGATLCIYEGILRFIEDNSFRYELAMNLEKDLKNIIPSVEEYNDQYIKLLEQSSKKI